MTVVGKSTDDSLHLMGREMQLLMKYKIVNLRKSLNPVIPVKNAGRVPYSSMNYTVEKTHVRNGKFKSATSWLPVFNCDTFTS
jgi:hypothetical protein